MESHSEVPAVPPRRKSKKTTKDAPEVQCMDCRKQESYENLTIDNKIFNFTKRDEQIIAELVETGRENDDIADVAAGFSKDIQQLQHTDPINILSYKNQDISQTFKETQYTESTEAGVALKTLLESKKTIIEDLSMKEIGESKSEVKKNITYNIDESAKTKTIFVDKERESQETPKQSDEAREIQPYQVTTPTSTRRVQSQRFSREERPNLVPIHISGSENYSSDEDEERYTVEEPKDEEERARIHSSPDIFGVEVHKSIKKKINLIQEELEVKEETKNKLWTEPQKNALLQSDEADETKVAIEKEKEPVNQTQKDTEKIDELLRCEIVSKSQQEVVPKVENVFPTKEKITTEEVQLSTLTGEKNQNECDDGTEIVSDPKTNELMKKAKTDDISQKSMESNTVIEVEDSLDIQEQFATPTMSSNFDSADEPKLDSLLNEGKAYFEKESNELKTLVLEEQLINAETEINKSTTKANLIENASICKSIETDLQSPKIIPSSDQEPFLTREESETKCADVLEPLKSPPPEKPRALFHIESDDEIQVDIDLDARQPDDSESSVEEFVEKIKQELQVKLEREDIGRLGIFHNLSDDSLSKTKELVDERLRKISDPKPPERDTEETPIQIGRFQVVPAPDPVVAKEITEKLTEAEFEEVIRELKMEGLQPGVYLLPEEKEKQEKKEKTLKRVERRFERMASETLEAEKREGEDVEEKLDEKREAEFERLVSQLSTEEVAESQQDYLALWDEGGLSSLTPTDDWESRDPDTPNNELDEDTPKKSDNIGGLKGGDKGFIKPEPNPQLFPKDESSSCQLPIEFGVSADLQSRSPSQEETKDNENQSYVDRKKFWEQMSQSSDQRSFESINSLASNESSVTMRGQRNVEQVKNELRKSMDDAGLVKTLTESYSEKIAAGEMVMPAIPRPLSGPPKMQEGEDLQMLNRQNSTDRAVLSELEVRFQQQKVGEPTTDLIVDELTNQEESDTKNPLLIDENALRKGKQISREESHDSEVDFLAKYGEEVVAFENSGFVDEDDQIPLSDRKQIFEQKFQKRPPPVFSKRTSIYERSMSLPPEEIGEAITLKSTKRHFEAQMKKEIIVEQLMTLVDEEYSPPEHKSIAGIAIPAEVKTQGAKFQLSPEERFQKEVEEVAKLTVKELIAESEDLADIRRRSTEKLELELTDTTITAISSSAEEALQFKRSESVSKPSDSLEVHIDKSETESSEKEREIDEVLKTLEKDEMVTLKASGPQILETGSVGESEDTQSESDVTPEDARVGNDEVQWDISGIHLDSVSPKEDLDVRIRDGQRIGRWVGQENLAEEPWQRNEEKYEFPIETKWERTRSESASPKDPVVYTPEEHYPDTVWEVPVQEQLNTEEVTQDIPIEKQTIIEKDEEYEDEEQCGFTEAEARDIAEEMMDFIEDEVEKRASLMANQTTEYENETTVMNETVSNYIRKLAGEKDLNDREVELIESVLARKQREEIMKIQRNDTTASSLEITDEDLRSSGMDTDASPTESQAEKTLKSSQIVFKTDEDVVVKTIEEVKESLEAAKEELIENRKRTQCDVIKESPSEFEFTKINQSIAKEDVAGGEKSNIRNFSLDMQNEDKIIVEEKTKENVESHYHEEAMEYSKTPKTNSETGEIVQISEIGIKRGESEDSHEDIKSPPGQDPSSSSSGGHHTTSKSDIIFRHSSSCSRSGRKTVDRLSAAEPYSSSGESYYQSFENTSSRPCSSDVEALLASGTGTTVSSEYESAVSQTRLTASGDYVTAKSSLSSRESIKSLDSESSGNLGSVEISSEASETLIASAMELDRDEGSGVILLDDDSPEMLEKPIRPAYMTQHSAPATANRKSIDEDFEPVSDCEPVSWTGEASEDELTEQASIPPERSLEIKMKRSQEMTFQPVPKPIISTESIESSPGDITLEKYTYGSSVEETISMMSMQEDKLGSSLEETGSVLSMSLSTASEASAVRTIIELSRTESDKIDTSMTMSGASADSGSREELNSYIMPSIPPTSDIGTSTASGSVGGKSSSVTITTSSIDDSGTFCVSTQVTSLSRKSSEADDVSQSSVALTSTSENSVVERATKKHQGHRRKESTGSFVQNMLWNVGEKNSSKVKVEVDDVEERAESDQFSHQITLTEKEGKHEEKKESDDSEKTEESHQTEADQAINQDLKEGKIFVRERATSLDDFKDDTPDFSTSVTDLDIEDSETFRKDEFVSHPSPVTEERSETQSQSDLLGEKLLPVNKDDATPTSPGEIPGITVTQHLAPLIDRDFHYPDLELELEQESKKAEEETPQTPASLSSRGSSTTSTDQGREYVVNEDSEVDDKQTASMTTVQTVREPLREEEELSSPNSDSFELLDKPDLSEEYVIIEEVGKEAEENDREGKSVAIGAKQRKIVKRKEDNLIESPPALETKMTDVKYFPGDDVGPFPFESESASASSSANSEELDIEQYERQLEESKRWIEMQFQGEQPEYERGPLEDIKEEELHEMDCSSKIGSIGSMKESLGSLGSMKGSFGSTPDYDVLAGKKYFTRGDNDDISMSSLQEFELLEKKILDGRKSGSSGSSQDSLSCRKLGTSNKSAGGDDFSGSSLKEFENIENVIVNVVEIEKKVKEEEILLSEIEEGHESQMSESESCEAKSAKPLEKESDSEDFERKMFEIDEIIKQAKTNVESFMDAQALEKVESIGLGDSLEEVSKIPGLHFDQIKSKNRKSCYSTEVVTKKQVQQWRAEEGEFLHTSTDSADYRRGSDSFDLKQKVLSTSMDSVEQEIKKKSDTITDSIEQGDTISIDSFDIRCEKKGSDTLSIDSFDRGTRPISDVVSDSLEALHRTDSLEFGEEEMGAICRAVDLPRRPPPRSDYILGSSDSLDPSSSTATHATYHYETDSVMSSSFTSGGSNTLVSDGEHQDLDGAELPQSSGIWFENLASGTESFVTETVERLNDPEFSHTIHRVVETTPEVRKVVFTGPGAEESLRSYVEGFQPGEDITESEEVDEHGNVHVKRIIQRRLVVRPEELEGNNMTSEQLKSYFQQFETQSCGETSSQFTTEIHRDTQLKGTSFQTQSFSLTHANTGKSTGDEFDPQASLSDNQASTSGVKARHQLVTDISMDDDAEYDPTEHDWRHHVERLHSEADEVDIDQQLDAALAGPEPPVTKP